MNALLRTLWSRLVRRPEKPAAASQRHMQQPWNELGSSLVSVHLAGTTHTGFLVGHTRHRRRKWKRSK